MMKFGGGLVGGVCCVGVKFCMVFLSLVLSRFDPLRGGM